MKDFPIIWLLFNTKTGRIILGLFIAYIIVSLVGWWIVPIIAALIAVFFLYEYYTNRLSKNKGDLITGISFLVFALVFVLFYVFYLNRYRYFPEEPRYYEPMNTEELIDTSTWVPDDTAYVSETIKPKAKKSGNYSSSSISKSHSYTVHNNDDDDENMRGFDPPSEDDMDDNGMSRYIENNDEEGWN